MVLARLHYADNVHTSLMVPEEYLSKFDFMQPTDKQGLVWSHDPINLTKTPREGHTRQLYSAMVRHLFYCIRT